MKHEPVVGVSIFGGLGNQMFQYAAGMALARRLGARLLCDTGAFAGEQPSRPLQLPAFGLALEDFGRPSPGRLRSLAGRLRLVHDPFRDAALFDGGLVYDPAFERLRAPVRLTGYSQSWHYFEGHEAAVRAAFDTARLAAPRAAALADEIRNSRCAVAVHVRRGDYALPQQVGIHGLLPDAYYLAARGIIESTSEAPTWFLFSDDIGQASAELAGIPGLRPVTGFYPTEDLWLMSLCRHFIIANSTFSWWAAWLGQAADKQVVAPRAWFGPAMSTPWRVEDRVPPGWIAI